MQHYSFFRNYLISFSDCHYFFHIFLLIYNVELFIEDLCNNKLFPCLGWQNKNLGLMWNFFFDKKRLNIGIGTQQMMI